MVMASFAIYLQTIVSGGILTREEADAAFSDIMEGTVSPVLLASFLTALRMRGEREEELEGAVSAVRRHMRSLENVPEGAVDVCGTGGDALRSLNVSTAVAFILAGMGVKVAKHGNRALSSRSGAVDVLEELGIDSLDDCQALRQRLHDDGLVFMAAPHHHPAMQYAASVRRALGFRTLLNLVGPLCNPARVRRQLLGVFDKRWLEPLAQVLVRLGSEQVWTVHSVTDEGGSDELTLAGPNHVVDRRPGHSVNVTFCAHDVGLSYRPVADIRGADPVYNAHALRRLLDGEPGAYRETVLLNAAAALHVAGQGHVLCNGRLDGRAFVENIARAAASLDSGAAKMALDRASRSQSTRSHEINLEPS